MTRVAANVEKNQLVRATSTSMTHHASATAVISRSAAQENTMTMIRVNASVKIHQLAMLLTIMTQIRVNVSVDHTIAMLVNILTITAVAANAQSTRPVQTISISMIQLVSVSVVM